MPGDTGATSKGRVPGPAPWGMGQPVCVTRPGATPRIGQQVAPGARQWIWAPAWPTHAPASPLLVPCAHLLQSSRRPAKWDGETEAW